MYTAPPIHRWQSGLPFFSLPHNCTHNGEVPLLLNELHSGPDGICRLTALALLIVSSGMKMMVKHKAFPLFFSKKNVYTSFKQVYLSSHLRNISILSQSKDAVSQTNMLLLENKEE